MARARTSALRIARLRCEDLVNPVGIDTQRPRLSWELACTDAARRAARQTARRIRVRDERGRLAATARVSQCVSDPAASSSKSNTFTEHPFPE